MGNGKFHKIRQRWNKMTRGPAGNVIYVVLGFLIALAINEGLKPVLATDTPVVAVFSQSMIPTFYKGDMVIVQGAEDYKVGDVIVYDAPAYRYPIIHRIIEVKPTGFITKGDNNPDRDPWVIQKGRIHGRAVGYIPLLGWVKVTAFQVFGVA